MSKKIMMVLMGLEIGGAETHVVELSKELHRRGHEILVVSNGGVYEEELTRVGIRCFRAPLHVRSGKTMLRSYRILKRIIREERPDMVHAHARIPAFLCGILHRQMGFPFVTSAHWVFYVNPLLRRLTNWGERTVAVSEDIRTYLKENYGIPEEHVIVTINGIDTEKFSPRVSGKNVLDEVGFRTDRPTIAYVSRMDDSRALVARHLVEIAPRLRQEIPGLQILIAGDGDVFHEVKAGADEANARAGEDYIAMLGARTDINEIVAAGDLFVGVSRAALEAMAAAKPVIVAGNEGYIGLFREDKLELAQENNFCCRGCEQSSPERLYQDVVHAMCDLNSQQREELGQYGREVIGRYYSVSRMANDCEEAYRQVWAERTHVLVSGYYGFHNLGDDAILLALRDRLEALMPGATLTAFSNAPEETVACCGIPSVHRFRPFAVLRAMRKCTCFVSGGGSLLQDHTSTRSLVYYTTLVRLAARRNKKIIFYANGIGPVRNERNRERVRKVAELANVITLRDQASFDELRSMGVKNPNVYVTADLVYTMETGCVERGRTLMQEYGIPMDRPLVGVSARFARGMEINIEEFARFCDMISQSCRVVFLAMQQPDDDLVSEGIREKMNSEAWIVKTPYAPQDMMSVLSCMDAVVSTRLHSIIFAARERVPVLGIVYDPKVEACLREIGMPDAGTLREFHAETAFEALQNVLNDRERYVEILDERVSVLEQRAAENDRLFEELLNR